MENVAAIHTSSVGSEARNQGDTSSLKPAFLPLQLFGRACSVCCKPKPVKSNGYIPEAKRVDGKRLARLPTGDSRVFIQREEMQRPDTAVHVLLDCSGSMSRIQEVANQTTVSLALAVSTIPKCDISLRRCSRELVEGRSDTASWSACSDLVWDDSLCAQVEVLPLAEAMLYAARESY